MSAMYFVDGENLVFRYQTMIASGRIPVQHRVIHHQDVFVWAKGLLSPAYARADVRRVTYYTSAVGSDDQIKQIRNRLGSLTFYGTEGGGAWPFTHTPRVFKKPAKTHRSRLVDVSLSIDVLHQVYGGHAQDIGIISGDGDFLPLIVAAKNGGARVTVLAFSDGLSPELQHEADAFYSLDGFFFDDPK
jgi:hypothetical protein